MSRSYKHTPMYTDRTHGAKWWKRQANRKVRHYKKELDNGRMYKKIYESWEIHDWVSYCPEKNALAYYNKSIAEFGTRYFYYDIREDYPTFEIYRDKYWKKYHYRK